MVSCTSVNSSPMRCNALCSISLVTRGGAWSCGRPCGACAGATPAAASTVTSRIQSRRSRSSGIVRLSYQAALTPNLEPSLNGDRIVIGGVRTAHDARVFQLDGASYEDVIEASQNHVRADAPVTECVAVTGLAQSRDERRMAGLGVQIARHDDRCSGG